MLCKVMAIAGYFDTRTQGYLEQTSLRALFTGVLVPFVASNTCEQYRVALLTPWGRTKGEFRAWLDTMPFIMNSSGSYGDLLLKARVWEGFVSSINGSTTY